MLRNLRKFQDKKKPNNSVCPRFPVTNRVQIFAYLFFGISGRVMGKVKFKCKISACK
ncbi:unnamed protein product [Tenebrio molitor]|nr:unnamed protein product [Tenebrio molitor]